MNQTTASARLPRRTTKLSWRQTFAVFARYWLHDRRQIRVIVRLQLLLIAADTVTPLGIGSLIGALARSDATQQPEDITRHFALVAAALVAAIGFRQLLDRRWNSASIRAMQRLQLELFARAQRLSTDWHSSNLSGATVHRISRARWALDMLSQIIVLRLLQPIVLLFVLGTMITLRTPLAGLAFCGMSALFMVVSVLLAVLWVRPSAVAAAARDSRLTGALADAINNNAAVKAFAAEAREDARLTAVSQEWSQLAAVSFDRATDANALQMLLWVAAQLSVIGFVTWLAVTGHATVTDSAFTISATVMLSGQLRSIGQDIRTTQRAYAELEDAAEFLLAPHEVVAPAMNPCSTARSPKVSDGVDWGRITFDDVSFAYPDGTRVYENLSFAIEPGECVALVGASGSGKSTAFKLLQRLYAPGGGTISIDGRDIADIDPYTLRTLISVVPQEPVLFHRSLAENIAYARPDAPFDAIVSAARHARAHDFIGRLPTGYDNIVGERGVKLSGGERQRVVIARAMLADRPILLLDEATSALDTPTERAVQEALDALIERRTTLVVAHRLSTVRRADRILVFEKGRIVEQGDHAQLMALNGHYRKVHDLQVETSMLSVGGGLAG